VLYHLGWCKWTGQFGNAYEAYGGNEIDEALRNAHE